MPNHSLEMQLVRRILLLLERGFSERAIKREAGISRTTLRRYLERFRKSPYSFSELLELNDADLSAIAYNASASPPNRSP